MEQALNGPRQGTSARPMTEMNFGARLGTASMLPDGSGLFINTAKLNLAKYTTRPAMAKGLFNYLLFFTNEPARASELAHHMVLAAGGKEDWWWLARLGLCSYKLGMLREAEAHLLVSFKKQPMILTAHLLAKLYRQLDKPKQAIWAFEQAAISFPEDTTLITGMSRLCAELGDADRSLEHYRHALSLDSTNAEAIASVAAVAFYTDQPETALVYYRRLLQMGITSTPLFNNLGLCCFYAQQYDLVFTCFQRALTIAESDVVKADVWYNISHVATSLGDVGFAYQCLKLAVMCNPAHAEGLSNLGVLEHKKKNIHPASSHFESALRSNPVLHEAHFNAMLLHRQRGDIDSARKSAVAAASSFPTHADTQKNLKDLRNLLRTL